MGVFNVAVKPKDMDVEPIETLSLYERYTKTKLFKAVKPYFFCLYLTGMHFSKSYKECEKGKLESTNKKRSKIPTVSQVYSTLILLLFWVNVVRHIFMLPPFNFGTAYFLKLVTFHTMFLSAVSLSCNYAANCNSNLFPKLFLLWSELPNDEKRVRNLSRGCIFIILHVCFLMGGRQAIIIRGYSQPSFKENITWPFVLENQIAMLVVRCVVYFLDTMDIAIWAFSLTQFYSISLAFALDYNAVNEDLTRAVKSSPKLSEQTFKEIKSNHQKLCELVELADGFLSPYLAFLLVTQICNICFIFYSVVYKEGIESSFMFGLVCLGVQSFLTLLGAVVPAAYLNTKVWLLLSFDLPYILRTFLNFEYACILETALFFGIT